MSIRFFVIFLDTSSRIHKFPPSVSRDPSYGPSEFQEEGMLELLRPHILSHNFDVHFTRVLPPGTTDLRPLIESEKWLNAGGPFMKDLSSPGKSTLEIELRGGGIAPMEFAHRLSIILAQIGAHVSPVSH